MKTKNIVSIFLMGVLSVSAASAQQNKAVQTKKLERTHKPDQEKFKAMKIAYLTENISLTTEESQKFWPIYNEYESKKKTERKEFRSDKKELAESTELSDAEIEKMLNARIQFKQDELNLEKEYLVKFKAVLPLKKVGELFKAEESFKRDLLRKMKNSPASSTPPTEK